MRKAFTHVFEYVSHENVGAGVELKGIGCMLVYSNMKGNVGYA